uniref:Uncharacterized protein n=1 Tax=Oryza sativa subsp. japonica TaxID=39947 RepID=Q69KI4_ORYSJ|nr:hypothetical protein [Oryza sativa Japonica Group]BAD36556.1 hypothetical protein [Oryza sativa Japonica Group]
MIHYSVPDCEAARSPWGSLGSPLPLRFARLLPVRPRRLAFLSARVFRAFVNARNRE